MKNKYHDIIRQRLHKYRKECLACLYPPTGWEWGCTNRKYKMNTLALVNKIMKGIPVDAWPKFVNVDWQHDVYKVASGNWCMRLRWDYKIRSADLKYRHDDHTAWCIERNGKFVDYDIGGS